MTADDGAPPIVPSTKLNVWPFVMVFAAEQVAVESDVDVTDIVLHPVTFTPLICMERTNEGVVVPPV
jgi:hypothetical protein